MFQFTWLSLRNLYIKYRSPRQFNVRIKSSTKLKALLLNNLAKFFYTNPKLAGGLPHSEIPGLKVAWHLPEAYRSLLRPSSSTSPKASTDSPYVTCFILKNLVLIGSYKKPRTLIFLWNL